MSAVTAPDALEELAALERDYLAMQALVVERIEKATSAMETTAELRVRYVEAHARALKAGLEVPTRVGAGTLPGATNPDGLRARWLNALGVRW